MTQSSNCSDTPEDLGKVDIRSRVNDFNDMLKDIDSLDDKKRRLWAEIYENALTDRQNAYACYARLNQICGEQTSEHAIHGRTIATYLERMSKANDQLIKLADLVAREQTKDDNLTSDQMFDAIGKKK